MSTLAIIAIFQPFVDLAEIIIKFFQGTVGLSWGLAIVALTFTIRLLVTPLSIRGIKSMRRMQVLGPQMKEIQERYADDKERQQREMMKMYRENKINPLASCLPFLLQIPFFIAIYSLLRGESFVTDVQQSGATESFLFVQSVIARPEGAEMIALMVLFVGTTVLSFLYTTATTTTAQGPTKYIFLALPVLFVPVIVQQPAGLAVYWITTNIWSLGQQVVVQRLIPAPTPEQAAATAPAKPPPPPPRKKKRRR